MPTTTTTPPAAPPALRPKALPRPPEPREAWQVTTSGHLAPGDPYGPRGAWLRWAGYGRIELTADRITDDSWTITIHYTHQGRAQRQELGVVARERGWWQAPADPALRQTRNTETGGTMRAAAEHLARATDPRPDQAAVLAAARRAERADRRRSAKRGQGADATRP